MPTIWYDIYGDIKWMINTPTHSLSFRTVWQTTPNSITTNVVMTALTAEGRGENKNVVRLYLLPNAAQAACYRRKACAVSKTTVRIRQNWSTVQPADKMVRVMQLAFLQVGYCRTPNSTHKAPLLTCQSFQTTKKRSFLQLGHCVLLRPCVPQSLYPVSSLCTAIPVQSVYSPCVP